MDNFQFKNYHKTKELFDELRNFFGPRCTAVKVNGEPYNFVNYPQKILKFCEAVHFSFQVPVQINKDNIDCPGARRNLGFDRNTDELAKNISINADMPYSYIREILDEIPPVEKPVDNIILGQSGELLDEIVPDVYIIYTKPVIITRFIHQLTRMKMQPFIPPFSLNSICANIFARSYQSGEITISFGCPDSRNHGGVKDEEVIVGIPFEKAEYFIENKTGGKVKKK